MVIKKLILNNFGVYAGRNVFDFVHQKPIVLIGGMNGRGKTTFLEAILLALYGSNSVAFKESKYKAYSRYLEAHMNRNSLDQTAFIELEFYENKGAQQKYSIHREWNADTKRVTETIVAKENDLYSDFLTKNWAMFVENLLPNALSGFYFFNGEKIADMAVDETNAQLKDSIRSMLGIGVLDVLRNDIGKCLRRVTKDLQGNNSVNEIQNIRAERESLEKQAQMFESELETLTQKKEICEKRLEELRHRYEIKGGAASERRQELLQQQAELHAALEQNQNQLVEIASNELPLVLVNDLILQIKLQAEDEHNDLVMQQALEQINELLESYCEKHPEHAQESKSFVEYIKEHSGMNVNDPVYQVSDHALFQLNTLLEKLLEDSKKAANEVLLKKRELRKQLNNVESYLSLDIDESTLEKIRNQMKKIEAEVVRIEVHIKDVQQKSSEINGKLTEKNAELRDAVDIYLKNAEFLDDSERMMKYSNLALRILNEYSVALQSRKARALSETITACYKKLASKKNLIERIEMDPETLDVHYFGEDGMIVDQGSLSAGEKQLMVISILWALAICSKKKLPVIIDTPLSRLDSTHRAALVTTYFPQASEQTIILSTDSEIDRHYYDMMQEYIGDEFTLNYSEETKSTTISRGYFQER